GRHKRSVGREAGGGRERSQPRAEFRDVAAIAKTRAANNINQSAGDVITGRYGNVGNRHRNNAAVSARGNSTNLVGNHRIGASARGQNANVDEDHETGVSAIGYSRNLVGNHGIGASTTG